MEMPPFRNRIYAICLYTEIENYCEHYSDFQKPSSSKPSLFFKIPYQILSWKAIPGIFKGYYIFFTEDFLLKYKSLTDLIFDLPFLRHDQTLPCEIDSDELKVLKNIFESICKEYHGNKKDKFDLIAAYLQVLFHQIRRVYERSATLSPELAHADNKNDAFFKYSKRFCLDFPAYHVYNDIGIFYNPGKILMLMINHFIRA